jgi:Co/Zn/Cd efflux system component
VDPVFAIGIALYILYSAGQIGHESVQLLMDRELSPEVHARIKEIVRGHPLVLGVHDVRTRSSGQTYFIQLHLMLESRDRSIVLLSLAAARFNPSAVGPPALRLPSPGNVRSPGSLVRALPFGWVARLTRS